MANEIVTAKLEGGNVKLYNGRGGYIRTLGAYGATSVDVSGGYVSIHFKDGKIKLYSPTGQYVRTI